MYLPILSPIGAIDGMCGYGSPAAPWAVPVSLDSARAGTTHAQATTMATANRRSLTYRPPSVGVSRWWRHGGRFAPGASPREDVSRSSPDDSSHPQRADAVQIVDRGHCACRKLLVKIRRASVVLLVAAGIARPDPHRPGEG